MVGVPDPSPLTEDVLIVFCRSVLNMVHHLTGHQVPGISRFQTFSCDLTERTRELLQQNEAVLKFLRWTLNNDYADILF